MAINVIQTKTLQNGEARFIWNSALGEEAFLKKANSHQVLHIWGGVERKKKWKLDSIWKRVCVGFGKECPGLARSAVLSGVAFCRRDPWQSALRSAVTFKSAPVGGGSKQLNSYPGPPSYTHTPLFTESNAPQRSTSPSSAARWSQDIWRIGWCHSLRNQTKKWQNFWTIIAAILQLVWLYLPLALYLLWRLNSQILGPRLNWQRNDQTWLGMKQYCLKGQHGVFEGCLMVAA